jgi:hypothetical protein
MVKDHFQDLLQPLFSAEVHFMHVDRKTDELIYRLDWKMPITGRPNRYSRPVEIHLPFDTLEDHRMASNTLREAMERRMVNFIQAKLTSFNPEHGPTEL